MSPPVPSTARLLATSSSPEEMRRAIAEQAMMIDRHGQTHEATAYRLRLLEGGCADCKGDREQAESLVLQKLERLDEKLEISLSQMLAEITALKTERSTMSNVVKGVFALAGLLVAAKAAGFF